MIKGSLDGLRAMPPRRVTVSVSLLIIILLCWTILSFEAEYGYSPIAASGSEPADPSTPSTPPPLIPSGYLATCGNETHAAARRRWLEADARYSHLMDDKFTIVMPTYQRPDTLNTTLSKLLAEEIPSLHEIVIVWNDLSTTPPQNWVSDPWRVPVRYVVPDRNSLNNRFRPDPSYATQAVFSSDDDLWYEPDDLEFAFQAWRQLGRYRITGALPRCHSRNKDTGRLAYAQCAGESDWYSLVLTGVAFIHISFLDFYSAASIGTEKLSEEERGAVAIPTAIRAHVDEVFNCEDLAMNYIASMLTCTGPLHVMGKKPYQNLEPKGGISMKPGHWAKRGDCLNYLEEAIGFFPLVQQMGGIKRGVPRFK